MPKCNPVYQAEVVEYLPEIGEQQVIGWRTLAELGDAPDEFEYFAKAALSIDVVQDVLEVPAWINSLLETGGLVVDQDRHAL